MEGLRWLADARGREVGEPVRARAFVGEAVLALFLSDYPRAAQSLAEASTTVDAEDQEIRAVIDFVMGTLETTQGAEHGVALLEGARDLFTALDNRWGVTLSTLGLVWALVAAERDAPLELYESTVEAAGALGIEAETLALGALGRRLTLRGDISEAKKTLGEALVRTVSLRAVVGTALYVDLLGDVAAREGEDALAARLSAASEAFFASAGAEVPAMVGRRAERLSGLRDRLGRDAFEVEWAAGLALPLEDAVAAARAFAES